MRARAALVAGVPGAALFLVSSMLVRGGVFDDRRYGDVALYAHYAHEMTSGHWPYRDFFDEYPPLAQPLFLIVRLLPGTFFTGFRWTMVLCGAAAVVLVAALAGRPLSRALVAAGVAGVSPLLVGPVMLNTFDPFAALLTAAAVLAFVCGRERTTGVLLALAVGAKVYPLVLLPLVAVVRWRRALVWFVGVLVLVHLPFAVTGPGGLRFSYWVQLKRGLEVESLGAAVLLALDRLGIHHVVLHDEPPGSKNVIGGLADAVAVGSSLLVVAAVLFVAWRFARGRLALLTACAAAVTAFVAFGKVFSPQYVSWLALLVPAVGMLEAGMVAVVLALTHVVFDRFHAPSSQSDQYRHALTWWVVVRDLVVVGLFGVLVTRRRASRRA